MQVIERKMKIVRDKRKMKQVNNTKSETYTSNAPIFSVQTDNAGAVRLQGLGDERDAVASWVVFRMINPKAKQLKNSKLNKDGAWQSMSRNDSLKSVERKPVTLDEQQDCWQTCIAMILQNIHIQGFPLMTTDGKPFKIGGIHLHSKVYELFSACRDILRINNRKSDYCDSLDYLLAIGKDYAMPHKAEKHGIERVMRASAFREQMNLVRNSFAMDKSRQRNANRKNAIAFMRSVANGSISNISKSTRSMQAMKFRLYTSKGAAFNSQSIDCIELAKEMTAI